MYQVNDVVQVAGDAESCCCAEDAGHVGKIIKVTMKKCGVVYTVKSQAGEWFHCDKCITPVVFRTMKAPQD